MARGFESVATWTAIVDGIPMAWSHRATALRVADRLDIALYRIDHYTSRVDLVRDSAGEYRPGQVQVAQRLDDVSLNRLDEQDH